MKRVFIVHGRDNDAARDLNDCLSSLGLNPVILRDELHGSVTVIEKFEQAALEADYAIILLTPDDDGPGNEDMPRARQNVIFEMGWFFSRLGRDSTLLLHKGPIELPSDITGVLYLSFEHRPSELKTSIIRELENGGIFVAPAKGGDVTDR